MLHSSKHLQTLHRLKNYFRLSQQGFLGMIDQGITSATTFLTAILVGRFCSKEDLGLYALAFSIIVFVMILQTSIILTPYTIFSARLNNDQHIIYTGSTLIHQIFLSLMTSIFILTGAITLVPDSVFSRFRPVAFALAAAIGFVLLKEYLRRLCFANLQPKSAVILDLSTALIQLIGLGLLIYTGKLSASSVYLLMGLSCGIVSLIWLLNSKRFFKITLNEVIFHLRNNLSLGRWVLLSGITWAASMQLYPWIIGHIKDLDEVGTYFACVNAVAIMNPVLLGIGNILEPSLSHAFAKGGISQLRHDVVTSIIFLSGILLLIGTAISLYGSHFVVFLYGNKYSDTGLIVVILVFNTLIMSTNFVLSRSLFIIGRAVMDFKSNIVSTIISFSLGVIFIYLWGPAGAAMGLLLANLVGCPIRYAAFKVYCRSSDNLKKQSR